MARTRRRKMVFIDLMAERTSGRNPVGRFWRQASPVYTLYTHGLHAGPDKVLATTSWCRFFLTDEPPEPVPEFQSTWVNVGPDLTLDTEEPVDNFGFSDGGWVQIDWHLLDCPVEDRGRRYLDWLHGVMLRLAELRGWNTAPLTAAYDYCLARDVRAHFESPRRLSPDRRHLAQLNLQIDPDGDGQLTITVTDRSGDIVHQAAAHSRPSVAFHDWRTLARRLRWVDERTVRTGDPGMVGGQIVTLPLTTVEARLP